MGQNVVSPVGEIFSVAENYILPPRNPEGADTQVAGKWTPPHYSTYHSIARSLLGDNGFDEKALVGLPVTWIIQDVEKQLDGKTGSAAPTFADMRENVLKWAAFSAMYGAFFHNDVKQPLLVRRRNIHSMISPRTGLHTAIFLIGA